MVENRGSSERGSGLVLVALSLAFVVVGTLFLSLATDRVVDRSAAQAAADAAALAGAAEGRDGAAHFAERNGAELIAFSENSEGVSVTVSVDGVLATANARRSLSFDRDG